ncbi:hypothetical protein JCM11251_003792 [Rhodosporidiobolus azoricus]
MATAGVSERTRAVVILIACQSALFGYFILELAYYFQRFPSDRTGFRILVFWLATLILAYYAVRLAGAFHTVDAKVSGASEVAWPAGLGLASIALTSCVESTTEGFYVWRLWRVTKRIWMRAISCTLWLFSTTAHLVWIGIAAQDGRASLVNEPRQLLIVQLAFWGTFAEGIFVATCLLYELQFANDRKAIKQSTNSTVSQLVSLAMRTSGILVVFELVVATAVSVRSQPSFALITEVEYAAGIYTILAAIVTLYTLNFRSVMRAAPRPSPTSAPTLRMPSSSSGFNGSGPRAGFTHNSDIATTAAVDQNKTGVMKKRPKEGFKAALEWTKRTGWLGDRLERSEPSAHGSSGSASGGGGSGRKGAGGGSGSISLGRRGSVVAGGISVSQTISHVEEISQASMGEGERLREDDFLSPSGWRSTRDETDPCLTERDRPFPSTST